MRLRRRPRDLLDRRAEKILNRDGYVRLEGLASDDVDELRAVFDRTHEAPAGPVGTPTDDWRADPAPGPGFSNDLEFPFEHRDQLEELLDPFWRRFLPTLLVDHERVLTTYLMKWPGESQLTLHQDPTFVDETRGRSLTIWIALDDADDEIGNGPLYAVPRSHRVGYEYRGTATPSTYLGYLTELWEHTEPIPVRRGDVLVIDGRVIHGSPPNRTDRLRLAVCAPVVPRGSSLIHAVGDGDQSVVIHDVPDDFYRRSSPGRLIDDPPVNPPDARPIARAPEPFRLEAFG
ncbi:MAG: phytanoyl-CoA dioxygenase family protein [Actinomycetota bacterium]